VAGRLPVSDVSDPEGPIDVAPQDNPTSEPEPDIAVLAKTGPEYMGANPPASDVRLVIEVSDSTLAFDLGPKARLYARAGIPEYWVFDIGERRLIVHRSPQAGVYSMVTAYAEGGECDTAGFFGGGVSGCGGVSVSCRSGSGGRVGVLGRRPGGALLF
jgi:hypothetical protein